MIKSSKFHQVRIKTKKIMQGDGIPPPPSPPPPPPRAWIEGPQESLDWIGLNLINWC